MSPNPRTIIFFLFHALVFFTSGATATDGVTYVVVTHWQRSNTLVKIVEGSPVEQESIGVGPFVGTGEGTLVAVVSNPQQGWRRSVIVWDYESGHRRNEFTLEYVPVATVGARTGLAVKRDTVRFIGFDPEAPDFQYVLTECYLDTGNCHASPFPQSMTRARIVEAVPYREGLLICAPDRFTDVLIYEAGVFSGLPPEWARSKPNSQPRMNEQMRLIDRPPLLACVATHGGFAHVSNTGDIEVNTAVGKQRFDLAAPARLADRTIDRWLYPQVRSVDEGELLYIGETVYVPRNGSVFEDIEAVVAINTSDGAETLRIPLPGRVSGFQVLQNGNIRFSDRDTLTVRDYLIASDSFRVVAQFQPDEAWTIVFVPQP